MGVHESRQLERTSHGGDATSEISFMGARERSGREAGALQAFAQLRSARADSGLRTT
jgi:hypothetical protein